MKIVNNKIVTLLLTIILGLSGIVILFFLLIDYESQIYNTFDNLSLGSSHSAVVTDGRVYIWGANNYGQLGDSTIIDSYKPINITNQFSLIFGEKVEYISLGLNSSAAITSSGRLFIWGESENLIYGLNFNSVSTIPIDVTDQFDLNIEENIKIIEMGPNHFALITSEGRLLTWGSNLHGQLGNGTSSTSNGPNDITSNFNLHVDEKLSHISLGNFHSAALTSTGRVFTWGRNTSGQLGSTQTSSTNLPIDITPKFSLVPEEKVIMISLGSFHSSALTSRGRLFLWGENSKGQLGDATTLKNGTPREITLQFGFSASEKIVNVSLGEYHSAAISSEGKVFVWGSNLFGQLGDSTNSNNQTPIEITHQFNLVGEEKVSNIVLGKNHSIVRTSAERLYIWGLNQNGQLGIGSTKNINFPLKIIIESE